MENKEINIYEFLKAPLERQNEAWYDWFCKDEALLSKTKKLVKKIRQVALSKKIDINKQYIFFKNNCPMAGSLYDDFRICDIETGNVVYTVTPAVGYNNSKKEVKEGKRKGLSEVWGKENEFKEAFIEGTWKDMLKFFEV